MTNRKGIILLNDKPYKLSELVRCLENYEKIYGDIPVRFIDNDGNINDIFNVDLGSITLKDTDDNTVGYLTHVNLRSTFDYNTLKKEEAENEDQ